MLRSSSLLYYIAIFVVSFVCGVAIFHFVALEQAKVVIELVEPRLMHGGVGSLWRIVLPSFVIVTIMFLMATHSFLKYFVRIVVAIRITFFGFGSVFLLQELTSILVYAAWWFPFQLVYSVLYLLLAEVLVPTMMRQQKGYPFPFRAFSFVMILFAIVIGLEYFLIVSILL